MWTFKGGYVDVRGRQDRAGAGSRQDRTQGGRVVKSTQSSSPGSPAYAELPLQVHIMYVPRVLHTYQQYLPSKAAGMKYENACVCALSVKVACRAYCGVDKTRRGRRGGRLDRQTPYQAAACSLPWRTNERCIFRLGICVKYIIFIPIGEPSVWLHHIEITTYSSTPVHRLSWWAETLLSRYSVLRLLVKIS